MAKYLRKKPMQLFILQLWGRYTCCVVGKIKVECHFALRCKTHRRQMTYTNFAVNYDVDRVLNANARMVTVPILVLPYVANWAFSAVNERYWPHFFVRVSAA